MIAKHINFKQKAKSDIHRLVEYITAGQDKAHRVGEVMIANCRYDDPELVAMEMDIVQCRNKRARSDKTARLICNMAIRNGMRVCRNRQTPKINPYFYWLGKVFFEWKRSNMEW